ncbi:MAG: transcription elongation factor GreA [Candidatus Borkfalkiaceae bacterium]|nr:transcription elongation factor GreA [Christensenellaceae bacterium]
MSEKVILTEEGYQELEKRLEYLKFTKRPEITERIKIARDFGDLSENAEYDAAKNEQARIEGEIIEIEAQLKSAEIIKSSDIKKGVVSVGTKVKVYDEDEGEETVYEIVGTTEADISVNRISNVSPMGKALVGRKVGETVVVKAPTCEYKVRILEIVG